MANNTVRNAIIDLESARRLLLAHLERGLSLEQALAQWLAVLPRYKESHLPQVTSDPTWRQWPHASSNIIAAATALSQGRDVPGLEQIVEDFLHKDSQWGPLPPP